MSDASQLKKFLDSLGLSALEQFVDADLAKELEAEITGLGGVDAVLANELPPPPPPKPNAALGFLDPPIAAGDIEYACTDEKNGAVRQVASLDITTRAGFMDGMSVWRTRWKVDDHGLELEHEEIVRAADLRLLRHRGGSQFFRMSAFVAHDEVHVSTEVVTGKVHRESRKVRLPETAFTILPGLWAALAAAPIDRGWSTQVHLDRKIAKGQWRYLPVRLEVAGEERIVTPAGTFDCWIIDARGASGEPEVKDSYWVSRGDPSERVVARAHAWQPLEGSTRRYELVRLRRERGTTGGTATAGSPAQSPPSTEPKGGTRPAAASLELKPKGSWDANLGPIQLVRGGMGRLSPEKIEERLAESMEHVPAIEALRAAGKVPSGTSAAAIERYQRERAEYQDDLRARLALTNVWNDHNERRHTLTAVVQVECDEPRATYVRIRVPPRVGLELYGDSHHVDNIDAPRALSAPLDQRRRRFIARVHATQSREPGQYPSEKLTAPDGSNIVVLGPVPVSRMSPMYFDLRFAFDTWDDVASFTLGYDLSVYGMEPVTGSIPIEIQMSKWKPGR